MKFINNINSNWLGFSLSPDTNTNPTTSTMEDSTLPPSSSSSSSNPATYFNLPSYMTNIYGVEGEQNGNGVYTAFPIMPLKSDGSLCLMEAITRSQSQGMTITSTPVPKLENFFGGVPMYYNQNQDQHQNYRDYSSLGAPYQHHHHQQQQQHDLPSIGEDEDDINGMKNWISRNYDSGDHHDSGVGYGDLQSLRLSMSFGCSQSTPCATASSLIPAATVADCVALDNKKRGSEKVDQHNKQIVHRKSLDTFGQRTSQYRGVTRHRWTGRYEAHLWDNSCKKEGQSRKGRQVYLGGYDMEEKAARAYDLAALKYWGPATHINFPLENYEQEVVEMKNMSRQEYVAHLRRRSSGFSRGASVYRGVTRHHQHGRWQARIGRVAGNKDLYLGTFSTQEEAAEAYDVAAIKFRGVNAVTNFDISRYNVEKIIASNTLLASDLARRSPKEPDPTTTNDLSSDQQLVHIRDEPKTILTEPSTNMNMLDWKMTHYDDQNHTEPVGFEGEESSKHETYLSSNTSSLVTTLSGSREHSLERNLSMVCETQRSSASMILGSASGNMWIPKAAQMRAQIPVFAAWTDRDA